MRFIAWIIFKLYGLQTKIQLGEIKMNYIVKDDNPAVGFTLTGGEVTDSEGQPIETTFEVTVTDETVLELTLDEGNKSGTLAFGAPGLAEVEYVEKTLDGEIVASGSDGFTVTTGDPANIAPIVTTYEGLEPVS